LDEDVEQPQQYSWTTDGAPSATHHLLGHLGDAAQCHRPPAGAL